MIQGGGILLLVLLSPMIDSPSLMQLGCRVSLKRYIGSRQRISVSYFVTPSNRSEPTR